MILHWLIWPKPVIMTAKDIKMKVLAENLTVKTKYADEQGCLYDHRRGRLCDHAVFDAVEARKYSGDDEPIKLIVKPGENK